MIGQTISHYKITAKLGAGGMGEVYLATDAKLDRKVALKFLPSSMWNDAEAQQRLTREAKAASQLDHPNIVTIHGIEESEGRPFIVMAHVRGTTLDQYRTSAPRTTGDLIDLAIQIAAGLQHAHAAGVVHRDLKPANILVNADGHAKILDFGIAKLRDAVKLTQSGSTLGTLAYSSPEQARGEDADARSDLFSFGVVLYELLTGHRPFGGEHEAAIIYAVAHEQPQPLAQYRSDLSDGIQTIIDRCLAKNPRERYQSAADLRSDLRDYRGKSHGVRASETQTIPSLGVLPFANMSADPENEYFADGLTEDLITAFSKMENLRVVARTSAFQFKGKTNDVRKIGEQLNVSTVLEGSVRKVGNRVRVTAQLISVADGFHLWSEKYDRDLADVFAIQDEITSQITETLKVRLLTGQARPAPATPLANMEAYNLYLQGRFWWNTRSGDGIQRAITCFQKAIALEPRYALAHAGLADCYLLGRTYAWLPVDESMAKAKAAVHQALELDENLAEAHTSLAFIEHGLEWRFPAAEQRYLRAMALSPGYPTVHHWYALFLGAMGRFEEALREIAKAKELDPLSPIIGVASAGLLSDAGRQDEAVTELRGVLTRHPGFLPALYHLGLKLAEMAKFDEGLVLLKQAIDQETDREYAHACFARASALAGDPAAAIETLKTLERSERIKDRLAMPIGLVYDALGETDQVFLWFDRAAECRDWALTRIRTSGLSQKSLDDPRYARLIQRIGFPEIVQTPE